MRDSSCSSFSHYKHKEQKRDSELSTEEQRTPALKKKKKIMPLCFAAMGVCLSSLSKQCVLLWGHRGGLLNYQDFPARKTEPPYNSFYLLREGTVRFLSRPGHEWPQCWSEILPSAGRDPMCHINYVPNALLPYPCVSRGLMHL